MKDISIINQRRYAKEYNDGYIHHSTRVSPTCEGHRDWPSAESGMTNHDVRNDFHAHQRFCNQMSIGPSEVIILNRQLVVLPLLTELYIWALLSESATRTFA